MLMKTLLASILGLTALTSVALAGEPLHRGAVQQQLMQLTPAQMDQVTAGQTATASVTATASASGPTSSDVTGTADTTTAVTGGEAPSATSSLYLTLSSSSS
jgi:hypothetical protein